MRSLGADDPAPSVGVFRGAVAPAPRPYPQVPGQDGRLGALRQAGGARGAPLQRRGDPGVAEHAQRPRPARHLDVAAAVPSVVHGL